MQLQQLLEGEQWVAVEVPASVQAIADRLLARCASLSQGGISPSSSAPAVASTRGEGRAADGQNAADGEAAGASSSAAASVASAAQLHLLGRRFPVVTSSLILLKLLDEYLLLQVGGRG